MNATVPLYQWSDVVKMLSLYLEAEKLNYEVKDAHTIVVKEDLDVRHSEKSKETFINRKDGEALIDIKHGDRKSTITLWDYSMDIVWKGNVSVNQENGFLVISPFK